MAKTFQTRATDFLPKKDAEVGNEISCMKTSEVKVNSDLSSKAWMCSYVRGSLQLRFGPVCVCFGSGVCQFSVMLKSIDYRGEQSSSR